MRAIDADLYESELAKGTIISDDLYGMGIMVGVDYARKKLADVPTLTLDDLRPKGRWNPLPEDDREQMVGDQCSLCGYEHFGSRFNFCPSCGADMRGGGEDG